MHPDDHTYCATGITNDPPSIPVKQAHHTLAQRSGINLHASKASTLFPTMQGSEQYDLNISHAIRYSCLISIHVIHPDDHTYCASSSITDYDFCAFGVTDDTPPNPAEKNRGTLAQLSGICTYTYMNE